MMNSKRIALLAILVVAVGAAIFGMTRTSTSSSNKVSVVASFYPLYDFAKNVGGNKVSVSNMTPAGSEPHDYEPSPKALVDAEQSDVFIYNGGHLEPWTDKFVTDYENVAVKASRNVSLLPDANPHFWLDPVLAKQIVTNIRDGLIKADPANTNYYNKNADAYIAKLDKLNQAYKTGLAGCQQHTVISSHDAFGYLAKRYNIEIIPIAGLSPEEEPSAARLAELSDIVKNKGIRYVFFESLVSPRLADTIAQETGAKTLVFDPIEGLSVSDQQHGKNYLSIQYENIENLRTALACS